MLLAQIALLALGSTLLAFGLRGRRLDSHPTCRRCRFDLVGLDKPALCPECGAPLEGTHRGHPRVVVGNWRRRRSLIASGLVVLLLACSLWSYSTWKNRSGPGWVTQAPTWWLMIESRSKDPAAVEPILAELLARRARGKLSDANTRTLVERALAWQADVSRRWSDPWGAVLEAGLTANLLTDQQREAYAAHAIVIHLEARPRVRVGDELPVEAIIEARGSGCIAFAAETANITLGTQQLMSERFGASGEIGMAATPPRVQVQIMPRQEGPDPAAPADQPVSLTPGAYTLTTTWKVDVGPSRTPYLSGSTCGWGRAPGTGPIQHHRGPQDIWSTRTISATTQITVCPASEATVELITDPALAAAVRNAVTIELSDDPPSEYGRGGPRARVNVNGSPIDLAFEVEFEGIDLGRAHYSVKARNGFQTEIPLPRINGTYRAVLRPSPDAARGTITMTRIWGESITLDELKAPDGATR